MRRMYISYTLYTHTHIYVIYTHIYTHTHIYIYIYTGRPFGGVGFMWKKGMDRYISIMQSEYD